MVQFRLSRNTIAQPAFSDLRSVTEQQPCVLRRGPWSLMIPLSGAVLRVFLRKGASLLVVSNQ